MQEIVIHTGVNRATAILHPGAVYKGQKLPTQVGTERRPRSLRLSARNADRYNETDMS